MAKELVKYWNDGTPFTIRQDGYLIEFDVAENKNGCRLSEMTLSYADGDKEIFDLVQIGDKAVGRIETTHRTLIFGAQGGVYKVVLTPTDNG